MGAVCHAGVLDALVSNWGSHVDFVTVYITEAHARNEWPTGSKVSFCDQPTTTEERLTLAKSLVESKQVSVPMLVDTLDNTFESTFCPWPVRFYVLHGGRVAFKAQPTGYGYDFAEMSRYLESHRMNDGPFQHVLATKRRNKKKHEKRKQSASSH